MGGNQNVFYIPLPFARRGQWAAGDQEYHTGNRLLCSALTFVGETIGDDRLSEEKEKGSGFESPLGAEIPGRDTTKPPGIFWKS